MVKQTYSDTDKLLIWLGGDASYSNMAMDLTRTLGRTPSLRLWTMTEEEIAALASLLERP